MAIVIKEWRASEEPDANGIYVHIKGRDAGLFNFILSAVGIDPTLDLTVDSKNIRLELGSMSGFTRKITPLGNLCSGTFGYFKPWKSAMVICALSIILGYISSIITAIGIIGAFVYYFLNKQLQLRLTDVAGDFAANFSFQRSLIEGVDVDEKSGERVIQIIEGLLHNIGTSGKPLASAKTVTATTATSSATVFCAECGTKNDANAKVCKSCNAKITLLTS